MHGPSIKLARHEPTRLHSIAAIPTIQGVIVLWPSRTEAVDRPAAGLKTTRMALLVDKLRPRSLDALSYHHDLSARLKSLVSKTRQSRIFTRKIFSHNTSASGSKRRLPSPPRLRTVRRGQENPRNRNTKGIVRPRSREDQDRRSSLPDDE